MNKNKKDDKKKFVVGPQFVSRQLNRDARDAVLVASVLANAWLLAGWLVLQVTDKFDASIIGYFQGR